MTTDELRQKFLDFFSSKGHRIFPSDSLIPRDDPTVLFTAAGMNQFKPQFLGKINDFRRAASCQKCLRTDDLDKVGKTAGHHTFFEMLGNFSFGGYFKEEAIVWAWEFVTCILKIFPEKLWVSVYDEDNEAYEIWLKKIKIPEGKILRLGQKENFWPSNVVLNGPNGPCGPCSEIFFDQGKKVGCGKADCAPVCDCGRFVEVWNLVFTQFNRREDKSGRGNLEPLPQRNIDTGMGLERIAAVMQGVLTNFEIDIFKPIINEIEREAGSKKLEARNAVYAVADHIRAVTFAIADGVLPSNEERGYVVRKLIRKAAWHGRSLGMEGRFLYKLVPLIANVMNAPYPDLNARRENISQIVLAEEERFRNTLEEGLNILNNLIGELKEKKNNLVSGEDAFRLYDTYGFPLELTELIAAGEGLGVDKTGFNSRMEGQRKKSKEKSKMAKEIFATDKISLKDEFKASLSRRSEFLGYESLEIETKIGDIAKDGQSIGEAGVGEEVGIVLDETPFYAEAGGQAADTGIIEGENKKVEINNALRLGNCTVHLGKVVKGKIKNGDVVLAKVDRERRLDIMRNHTATHLLQAALRRVLGEHIQQAGSLVEPQRLRFDFTHFKAIDDEQLERVEELVNDFIRRNDKLNFETMELELARKSGALAFFGEKYEEEVRVVNIGDYSKELCGGTHLNYTGEIGLFLVLNEYSVAQGVRRIEAITGREAYSKIRQLHSLVKKISSDYKISPENIPDYLAGISGRIKAYEKEMKAFKLDSFRKLEAEELIDKASIIEGIKLVFKRLDEPVEVLREYVDILKEKAAKNAFIILSSGYETRTTVLIGFTPDLAKVMDAAASARFVAEIIAGSGGGRKDLAQAGSKDVEGLKLLENKESLFRVFKAAKVQQ